MPNWLERHIDKVLLRCGLDERNVVDVWFRERNAKRVVLTVMPEGGTAKRLSVPIPQVKG